MCASGVEELPFPRILLENIAPRAMMQFLLKNLKARYNACEELSKNHLSTDLHFIQKPRQFIGETGTWAPLFWSEANELCPRTLKHTPTAVLQNPLV